MFASFALEGSRVRLEPLSLRQVTGLLAAATADRSAFGFASVPGDEAAMTAYVKTALGAPDQYPYAIVDAASGEVLGSARFMTIERWDSPFRDGLFPHAVELGGIWASPAAAGSPLLQAYLLMLAEAFDEWQTHRVTLRADAEDGAARALIEQTGAALDGVLRGQQLPLGRPGPRSIASYSIVKGEWSSVKKVLTKKIG